jgi:hypothetical protein
MAENPSLGHEAIAAAAGIVPGLIARLTSGGADANVPPELRQLLAQSVQRQQYQNPLFQAVSNQAFQGLPSYARQGLSMPSGLPAPSPQSDGGGMPDWLKMAMAGAGGAAANGLGGGNALGALINGLKRLFGGGGRGEVQGNKPNAGGALTGPGAFDPSQFMGWDQGHRDETAGSGIRFCRVIRARFRGAGCRVIRVAAPASGRGCRATTAADSMGLATHGRNRWRSSIQRRGVRKTSSRPAGRIRTSSPTRPTRRRPPRARIPRKAGQRIARGPSVSSIRPRWADRGTPTRSVAGPMAGWIWPRFRKRSTARRKRKPTARSRPTARRRPRLVVERGKTGCDRRTSRRAAETHAR